MDSQDDSIDISQLKRDALGLEHDPSQAVLDKIRTIGPTSLHDNSKPDQPEQTILLAGVRPTEDGVYRPFANPNVSPSPSSPLVKTTILSNERTAFGPGEQRDHAASQSGIMSSGETAPGDTQVVSQSVFDSKIRQNKDTAGAEELENSGDIATYMTLSEDEAGNINLLSGFDNTHPDAMHTEENDDQTSSKIGESSPIHYQPNLFPESQRFLTITPARTAAEKTPGQGQSSETPRASHNPLTGDPGSAGGIMALSQVFKATQAPSSPLANGPQSDPMSDRPSPSVPLQRHSLADPLSSPFARRPTKSHRKSTELHYISMEESQAERDKLLGQRMTRPAEHVNSEDQSDNEFSKEPSFARRLRRQKIIDEEATAQFVNVTALSRPASRQAAENDNNVRTSPHGQSKRRDQSYSSSVHELDSEPPSRNDVQQRATSEAGEDAEQNEDLARHAHPSLDRNKLTEEDKENYNDTSEPNVSSAAGTHGRPSQILAVAESPSRNARVWTQEPSDSNQCLRSPNLGDPVDEGSRSSQGFVVKDSQQSLGRTREENNEENMTVRSSGQTFEREAISGMEVDAPLNLEKVASSPPCSTPERNPLSSHERVINTDTEEQPESENLGDSSNKHGEQPFAQNPRQTEDSNQVSHKFMDTNRDPRGKFSSVLSQIAETPLHQQPASSRDVAAVTNIPETSPNQPCSQSGPNAVNGDMQDQDDDDLPPMYPANHARAPESRPSDAQRSLLAAKRFHNPKILSSPSGRQRDSLTEIASIASPPTGPDHYDVGSFLTAEDQEFNNFFASSPIPPKKKRRTNFRRKVYASDPILPVTPRVPKSQSTNVQQEETIEEEPEPPESPTIARNTSRTHLKPIKRGDALWKVNSSQQSTDSQVEQPAKVGAPRRRGRPPLHARKYPKDLVAEAVVIHNRSSIGPSRSPSNADQRPMNTPTGVTRTDPERTITDGSEIMRNQVLALWPGKKLAYYAGTCFGVPGSKPPSRYLVKFEDSDFVEVSMSSVKRLELRIGDAVKLDMPDVPKITHIIRGFTDKLSAEELGKQTDSGLVPITDIYGHSKVILGPKQRKSLPNGALPGPENVITIPISKIYMDTILFNQLKDREFTYNSEAVQSDSRLRTPSERHSTPTSPSARLSRNIPAYTGLFSGMVFAVSYVENDDAKSRVTKMILENGGRILKEGFNELFEFPSNVPHVTPTNASEPGATESNVPFRLASAAEDVGFACLIADKHSRREKYMQALALNIPCLSGRWIEDCLAQSRILDWGMYLLPAGESMYLDGATKSRLLTPKPATSMRLQSTIADRPKLLAGQSVLLVMGRGRAEEKRRAYIFLTYALGASKVARVFDLKSAKAVLDQQVTAGADSNWNWTFVDDDEQEAAQSMILGRPVDVPQKPQPAKRGRKRKRPEPIDSAGNNGPNVNTKTKIVGNEFLCQSLILGRLFE
ncbi:hypothetical protein PHISCL_05382 [Aspergillus sclerotialis]|uniref:BRCT domain-containing protein n=1 Tax=Aspergillus sclerotialis TaxID=2070753 RepID=A0A3A2ZID0_9EURO|nr:hypothetical protein PHISCL_05382 [Aspergillus sclerotialis]